MSANEKKINRYERIYEQLENLTAPVDNPVSRMATIVAVLHHKQALFFWTGFYLLNDSGQLQVGPYQGPLACLELKKDTGVCWAGIRQEKTMVVSDVEKFPGHIACDSRSRSEIVVPLFDDKSKLIGVLDVDSDKYDSFDETDSQWLSRIVSLVYQKQ
ncbi:MAG: GAF domain-containing protein [Bacteroidota bacterium]